MGDKQTGPSSPLATPARATSTCTAPAEIELAYPVCCLLCFLKHSPGQGVKHRTDLPADGSYPHQFLTDVRVVQHEESLLALQ